MAQRASAVADGIASPATAPVPSVWPPLRSQPRSRSPMASPASAATTPRGTGSPAARAAATGHQHRQRLLRRPAVRRRHLGRQRRRQYAPRADLATQAEQIVIAEKVLNAAAGPPGPPAAAGSDSTGPTHAASPSKHPDGHSGASRAGDNRAGSQSASRGKHRKAHHHAVYVVRSGDTLSGIASRKHVAGGWAHLYHLNRSTIGSNPGLIKPGQRLHLH